MLRDIEPHLPEDLIEPLKGNHLINRLATFL